MVTGFFVFPKKRLTGSRTFIDIIDVILNLTFNGWCSFRAAREKVPVRVSFILRSSVMR